MQWINSKIFADVFGYAVGGIVALIIGYWQFGKKGRVIAKLQKDNAELRRDKYICENKQKTLKAAFNLVYSQYEQNLSKDEMEMLKGIKHIIESNEQR